ncbi:MAG: hypothetical protein LLF98_01875 [Clostridium sp.]|uniref:hypothetical protein n=1 Tax=Clostridium sp. TaxID=1506 RepID=UPI0025BBC43B|nr:hypothetical protein [Clostridium sp.]MCE5220029.1 hypothetical protein [Clostridium sp.]
MDNKQRLKILTSYQDNPMVHPLTCGKNSNHQNLVPVEEDDKVILKCSDCDYIQELTDNFIKLLRELDKNYKKGLEMYKEMTGNEEGELNVKNL